MTATAIYSTTQPSSTKRTTRCEVPPDEDGTKE